MLIVVSSDGPTRRIAPPFPGRRATRPLPGLSENPRIPLPRTPGSGSAQCGRQRTPAPSGCRLPDTLPTGLAGELPAVERHLGAGDEAARIAGEETGQRR